MLPSPVASRVDGFDVLFGAVISSRLSLLFRFDDVGIHYTNAVGNYCVIIFSPEK